MARDFLGQDTKLPINGKFQKVTGVDTVVQDIQILIGTVPGERVHRPNYGCRLYTRVWDNIDDVANLGVIDIRDAIIDYEPRVDLIEVSAQIERNTGTVRFSIIFNIKDTNTPQNLVFPFQTNVNG